MADFLSRSSTFLSDARVAGRLYDLGRFPGIVSPEAANDWVVGELLELKDVDATLAALDRYEDSEGIFPRQLSTAVLADGRETLAWVYFYAGPMQDARRVPSGDWFDR